MVLLVALELRTQTLTARRRTRKSAPTGKSKISRLERRGVALPERLAPFKFGPGDRRVAGVLRYRTRPEPRDESGR
uniref:Uncharacterized protein n=1 Tax=Fervidicoccus fontis TaxID=683846 RepID=A0A7J3ZL50_9CREN